jgi:hypothetical protein
VVRVLPTRRRKDARRGRVRRERRAAAQTSPQRTGPVELFLTQSPLQDRRMVVLRRCAAFHAMPPAQARLAAQGVVQRDAGEHRRPIHGCAGTRGSTPRDCAHARARIHMRTSTAATPSALQ